MLPPSVDTRAHCVPSSWHIIVTSTRAPCSTRNFVAAHFDSEGALLRNTPASTRRRTCVPLSRRGRKRSPAWSQSSSTGLPCTREPQGASRTPSTSLTFGEQRYLRPALWYSPLPGTLVTSKACSARTWRTVPGAGAKAATGPSTSLRPCFESKIQPVPSCRNVTSPILTRCVAVTKAPFVGPWPTLQVSEKEHLERSAMPLLEVTT
mmetsp:Transcript_30786/g.88286  ORF Transcript_30786/g.88286 Transcript_30786/m.88286 type:complete len:207 (-) Transcript_30786:248-868(-)